MEESRDRDIETLELEIESLKLNQQILQQNQALILSRLNINSSPTSTPTPTPTPTFASPVGITESVGTENLDIPPTKRRRKTVSKKYESDEQKMLLYGGNKIHLQVDCLRYMTTSFDRLS